MKSIFAALRSLVLPYGATSGQRIVLDGVNGRIAVYNSAGIQIGILDGTTGFQFTGSNESFQVDISGQTWIREVPDNGAFLNLKAAAGFGGVIFFQPENSVVPATTFTPGQIYSDAIEAGANSTPKIQMISPFVNGKASAQIVLFGQTNTSATDNSTMLVQCGNVTLSLTDTVTFTAERFVLGDTKFSRPNVTYTFTKSIPSGAVTGIAVGDYSPIFDTYPGLFNNGLFIADRAGLWKLRVHARYQSQAAVTGQRQIRYQINGVDTDYMAISPTTALNGTLVPIELNTEELLQQNDFISLQAFQNSGGALTLGNNARVHFELIQD
jgi:hypothetical protein